MCRKFLSTNEAAESAEAVHFPMSQSVVWVSNSLDWFCWVFLQDTPLFDGQNMSEPSVSGCDFPKTNPAIDPFAEVHSHSNERVHSSSRGGSMLSAFKQPP